MAFSLKTQLTINAPVERLWAALTQPELVKQYFFGTDLVTTWEPQTPIYFRGEWEGKPYEDKGRVLSFVPLQSLAYNYFSSWSDVEDKPENYQIIRYRVKPLGAKTVLFIEQHNIDTIDKKVHSLQNWKGLMVEIKKLLEHA
ncbi:MAG TPA: SRPBCC domain-containing protein [Saprospiraceae bacterium]|nr:SRPBCC domain-containing protein [Saprospiraceae bacterium]HRK83677.1 SRPBCC domain-containing protein [Saprospiraceae bacterium]